MCGILQKGERFHQLQRTVHGQLPFYRQTEKYLGVEISERREGREFLEVYQGVGRVQFGGKREFDFDPFGVQAADVADIEHTG